MNKQQLATKIWASANEMRSKIDASEYKDYILGFIFYKFLSEKEEAWLAEEGFTKKNYELLEESNQETVDFVRNNLHYFISRENLFSTWLEKGSDFDVSDVTDALSAFSRLIDQNHKHVFEHVFDTLETGLSKLGDSSGARTKAISNLLHLIQDIPMDTRQDYDVLGYIYEYLISNFAANAGKKAGEFYTPHEVSLLMSEIIAGYLKDQKEIEIYDPTSGSGSLLINIGKAITQQTGGKGNIKYYAQELKENTFNLTRMNLVMRGIAAQQIFVRNGDTLAEDWPLFENGHPETYRPLFVNACVSNPPYSQRWDASDAPDPRFDGYGIAPKSKADYAFLLHSLYHLRPDGIMCIVLPHGVLFRGGEEGQIRKNLIENDQIDAIIGLPANIFFGTGIPTIIMVLKKQRTQNDVLFIDASKYFEKEGKNNKLRASDIRRIVDAYENRQDVDKLCRGVSKEEIRSNDYNLNIPRYIDSSEKTETWDIYATMFGEIPKNDVGELSQYWEAFPALKEKLFEPVNDATLSLSTNEINETIRNHDSVKQYYSLYSSKFDSFDFWLFEELLEEVTLVPREIEERIIAKELFSRLEAIPLIDRYDAYQILDDIWQEIAIDLEIIQTEGFEAVKKVDPNMVTKKKKGKDVEVQEGWKGHVLPFALVQEKLLSQEKNEVSDLKTRQEEIDSETGQILEELTEEEKQEATETLNEKNDAFLGNKIKAVVKTLKADFKQESEDEESLIKKLIKVDDLFNEQKRIKKRLKFAEEELEIKTKSTIESLSDEQARDLLEAKWIQPFIAQLQEIPNKIINQFIETIGSLRDKYDTTFADIDEEIQSTENDLINMLGDLTGNEVDMAGIEELANLLGGN